MGTNGLSVFLGNGVFEGSLNAQNAIAANFRARGIPADDAQVPGAHDMMTAGQLFTIYARDILWDADKDGVDDASDVCADTVLPDMPSGNLKPNHYAATADGFVDRRRSGRVQPARGRWVLRFADRRVRRPRRRTPEARPLAGRARELDRLPDQLRALASAAWSPLQAAGTRWPLRTDPHRASTVCGGSTSTVQQ